MTNAPKRYIIVPTDTEAAELYQDDPDGLIWMATFSTLEAAMRHKQTAIVLPRIWDAPIIDPADPTTHREWDDELGRFTSKGEWL